MSKIKIAAALVSAAMLFGATAAGAKEYVDYSFGKGIWDINQIEVDPNHVDEYLTGLKRTQAPGFEIMKKHGIIDDYNILVRSGYSAGKANVVIAIHFVSVDGMMPNQARDQMIEKEILATLSEEAGKAAVAGYEKYRKFVDDSPWIGVTFNK